MNNEIENGFLLDNLFECNRHKDAFKIIKKNESIFTVDDFSVTGDMLLKHNYIDEAKCYLEKANDDGEALHRLEVIYAYIKNIKM